MPIDIGGALGGIGSFIGNQFSSAINSRRAWKYTQKAMALQDEYNRKFTHDSYGIMRNGLESAGYNPLLALGAPANTSSYSPSFMNADSDAGDQAITSAINAITARANIKNVNATTKKIEEEKKGIELENRLKLKQLNTDPKAVLSDLIEGENTPVTNFLKDVGNKLGISTGELNSAVSSQKKVVPIVIRLHSGSPYVQKGVPRSVVNNFNKIDSNSALSSKKKENEQIGVWNSSKRVNGRVLSDFEAKKYLSRKSNRTSNRPPKNFPSGM